MKKVLLVFYFKTNSSPFQIQMPDKDAQAIFEAFRSGARPDYWAGYVPEEDFYWTIATEEVAAINIHNVELLKQRQEEAKKLQLQGQPSLPNGR
jgi:hypothetical protein